MFFLNSYERYVVCYILFVYGCIRRYLKGILLGDLLLFGGDDVIWCIGF